MIRKIKSIPKAFCISLLDVVSLKRKKVVLARELHEIMLERVFEDFVQSRKLAATTLRSYRN